TEPGTIATGMLGRDVRVTPATTRLTPALIQYPVRHLHRDGGQFDHLVRMVRGGQRKCGVATRTSLGPQLPYCRGGEEHLAMPLMARFPTGFARRCGRRVPSRLLIG